MLDSICTETLRFIQTADNFSERCVKETKVWLDNNPENRVYLYGAGYLMQYYFRYLKQYDIAITAILDSYKEGEYQGVPIIRYDSFLAQELDVSHCRIFISAASAFSEIKEKLKECFPESSLIFIDWTFELGIEDMSLPEYRNYLVSHWEEVETLYGALADEKSKATLLNILKEHISGDPAFLLDTLDPDLDYPKDVIHLDNEEVFVELGANNGNTFLEFVKRCPAYKAAYLFEPEPCFQTQLNVIAQREALKGKNVQIIPKGVWDCETTLQFLSTEQENGTFVLSPQTAVTTSILTTTLDSAVREPFTYLKMDIEGAELHALRGAERHILDHRPKLGVSVYHKPTDLLDVWNYLRTLVPDYRFYLRNHTPLWDDIILYAI